MPRSYRNSPCIKAANQTILNRVTSLSVNVRNALHPDTLPERSEHSPEASTPADPRQLDMAEAQMRKALGLEGTTLRLPLDPEPERGEQGHRPAERGAFSGPRRRFVRDGDVPVTVRRRDPVAEPGRSRLQQAEAHVAAETAARTQAERALAEAQARDLQTKLGHAELAKDEALEAVRRNRETITELESEAAQQAALLREAEERALQAEQAKAGLQASFEKERAAR